MIKYRDIALKNDDRFDEKIDKRLPVRAVIVDAQGNDSGAGDIWADRNARRVWIREVGTASPSQVPCYNLRPEIGLGVLVGYELYSNVRQVLRSDTDFLGPTNPTGTSYESPDQDDFRPGGRLQLWLASKLIEPLATYPNATGLMVNVVSGYYPYSGVRTFFAGQTNIDLSASQPAGPNEHRLVGLYLDASNALQTVNGTAVSTAIDAPEPTWPTGAFQLGVVLLDDTQTSIGFGLDTDANNDVFDRRMLWVDIDSFGGGWPFAGVKTVSATDPDADYTTIALAIAGASAGNGILIDNATFSETLTVGKFLQFIGFGQEITVINGNGVTTTVSMYLRDIKIRNAAGVTPTAVTAVATGTQVYINTFIECINGVNPIGARIGVGAGFTNRIISCRITASGGSGTRTAVSVETSGTVVEIYGGYLSGTTYDIAVASGCVVRLYGPVLANGTINNSGTIGGHYYNIAGDLITVNGSSQSGGVWLQDASTEKKTHFQSTSLGAALTAAIAAAATGDIIILEAGTYTLASGETISTSGISLVAMSQGVVITCAVDDTITLNATGDNVTFRNLTINHTGAGGVGYPVAFDGDNFILDNCQLTKTGAPSLGAGLYQFGGTGAKAFNTFVTASGATTNRGYYNTIAVGAIEFFGGKLSGTQADIWSDVSTSTIATYGTVLEHNLVNYAGVYPRHNIQPLPVKPIMLNGHPLVWQRGTSFAAAANASYSADRFKYGKSGLMVHTLSRSTDVPTMAQAGVLLQYSLLADVTTIDASIGAGDHSEIMYTIEGYNFQRIAQQQFTIPLWIKATKTGIYCVAFRNSVADRSYVAEITINTTATWEYKQVTVIASPSAGTWDYAAGAGLFVTVAYAVGSTFQTTAGAWQTGNFLGTSSQVNACDDVANDVRVIFGTPIPGPYARPFEVQRIDDILDYAQRYYQKSYDLATDPGTNTALGAESYQTRTAIAASTAGVLRPNLIRFQPRLRTNTPTVTPYAVDGTSGAVSNTSGATVRTGATITASLGDKGFSRIEISNADADAITADQVISFHWTANGDF